MTEKKEPQKGQRDDQEKEKKEAASDLELSEEIAEQVAGGRAWTATNPKAEEPERS